MHELVSWLVSVEELASKVYKKSSEYFSDDKELFKLLTTLTEEEQNHYEIMSRISKNMENNYNLFTLIKVEESVQREIEFNFNTCLDGLETRTLSKYDFMEKVVTNECSEWNDLFMYVVSIYKESDSLAKILGIQMQRHKRILERYLESTHGYDDLLNKLRTLPNTWEEKFLVIDDEKSICDIIATVLEKEGTVDCVHNGEDALKKIGSNYYTAIISDVNMPKMNGIELYDKIVDIFPNIKNRFIFITGEADKHSQYFKDNELMNIAKPAPLPLIKEQILNILHKGKYVA